MSQSNRLGLLGRKVGMTRFFTDDGESVPVTVVDVSNNRVTQVKTQENDGFKPRNQPPNYRQPRLGSPHPRRHRR